MSDPVFNDAFRTQLDLLMRYRRDVRRFRTDPVDPQVFDRCLAAFATAPSVGLSEPWRILRLDSAAMRQAALTNFQEMNARALQGYAGDRAERYAGLKLSGLQEAPIQLAVYCDDGTSKGHGLGAQSMPEMRRYSVVSAVTLFWLRLRAEGLGLGWVSILDPDRLSRDLDVPADWTLIGLFCIGYPQNISDHPELERQGWEDRAKSPWVETR